MFPANTNDETSILPFLCFHSHLSTFCPRFGEKCNTNHSSPNAEFLEQLPFGDKQDFKDARQGFVGNDPELVMKNGRGQIVWDMKSYDFITEGAVAPPSIHPSLFGSVLKFIG